MTNRACPRTPWPWPSRRPPPAATARVPLGQRLVRRGAPQHHNQRLHLALRRVHAQEHLVRAHLTHLPLNIPHRLRHGVEAARPRHLLVAEHQELVAPEMHGYYVCTNRCAATTMLGCGRTQHHGCYTSQSSTSAQNRSPTARTSAPSRANRARTSRRRGIVADDHTSWRWPNVKPRASHLV